jgi:threonine dehydratase
LPIEATRDLVEAACAAPLAAALRVREQLASKRIALIATGGNASREQLLDVLAGEHAMRTEAFRETSPTGALGRLFLRARGDSVQRDTLVTARPRR